MIFENAKYEELIPDIEALLLEEFGFEDECIELLFQKFIKYLNEYMKKGQTCFEKVVA